MSNIEKGPNEKVCEAFLGELKELLAKYTISESKDYLIDSNLNIMSTTHRTSR